MNQGDTMIERLRALGSFFRFYRREQGLKQEEVAERAGVSKNTISQIERGQQWPSMQTYLRLIDVLGLDSYDATNHKILEQSHRRSEVMRDLGLESWYDSLSDDELRYGFVRAWEGIELMREMERRGLEHPYKRHLRHPSRLELLAPNEIAERTQRAFTGITKRA
jgi:transcriptional regulator with XRE-family HTH domain